MVARLQDTGLDPTADDANSDLSEITCRVVERMSILGRLRQVSVDAAIPDEPVRVGCQATFLEQAVTNLIHNAVVHNRPGGHVAVVLDVVDEAFTLKVLDDGPGVPDADLSRLTERLFRSDQARQRHPHGSGLGLAIAQEICKRCGLVLQLLANNPQGLQVVINGPRKTG
jgi:signal transduction histidine kinase